MGQWAFDRLHDALDTILSLAKRFHFAEVVDAVNRERRRVILDQAANEKKPPVLRRPGDH